MLSIKYYGMLTAYIMVEYIMVEVPMSIGLRDA